MNLKDLYLDVYLIRHADPVGTPNHWILPTTPLSESGIVQAKKLSHHLENHQFDAFFTSPLRRAKQTAEYIVKKSDFLSLQEQPWLAEIDLGNWSGSHKYEIIKQVPISFKGFLMEGYNIRGPLVANLLMIDKDFCFPSGESLKHFWDRVTTGFNQMISKFKGIGHKRICLIGHGGSLTIILLNLLGKTFSEDEYPIFLFGKADITKVHIRNERVFFVEINSLSQFFNEISVD